jgi:hypothetical protein
MRAKASLTADVVIFFMDLRRLRKARQAFLSPSQCISSWRAFRRRRRSIKKITTSAVSDAFAPDVVIFFMDLRRLRKARQLLMH